jgi:hypothetical protein
MPVLKLIKRNYAITWYHKKLKWQITVGFLVWAAGLTNIILHMN